MTESLKQFLSIMTLFFCLAILTIGFGITKWLKPKPMVEIDSSHQNTLLESFDYTHWKLNNGQTVKDYTITADTLGFESLSWGMLMFNWLKNMAIDHPTIQFYKNDREFTRIMAGKAYIAIPQHDYQEVLSTGNIVFEDNPQLVSSNGRVLSCSRLNWQRPGNTIRGTDGCQLQANNKVLEVNEILVNLNLDVI